MYQTPPAVKNRDMPHALVGSCFVVAAVHALLHAPPLITYVLTDGLPERDANPKRLNAHAVLREFVALAKAYWGAPSPQPLDPSALVQALTKFHKPSANPGPQEALVKILRALHEALGKTPGGWAGMAHVVSGRLLPGFDRTAWEAETPTIVHETFGAQVSNGSSVDHLTCLAVPVTASSQTLDECVRKAAWKVTWAPFVLVVHLKRSSKMSSAFVDFKVHWSVDFGNGAYRYVLFAVVCRKAGDDGGHAVLCEHGDSWWRCDDRAVTKIEDVAAELASPEACVLLYKRRF
jgi:hypothetical protein